MYQYKPGEISAVLVQRSEFYLVLVFN